jgi:hypothetical protein
MKNDNRLPFVVFKTLPSGGRSYVLALTRTGAVQREGYDMTYARRFTHRQALVVCARNGKAWMIANVNPYFQGQ